MNRKVVKLLKELGLWKRFVVMLVLRLPFDFLNAVLSANMLESFIRLIEEGKGERLMHNFWIFLLFTVLLFGYNVTIWSTISIKADMLFHRKLRMKLMEAMFSRSQQEMEEYSEGDWITRLNNDVDKTVNYITEPINFMHAAIAAFNFILSSIVLLVLNFNMFAVTIMIMFPFFYLCNFVILRKIPLYKKKAQESYAAYTNWLEPIAASGDIVTVYDGHKIVMDKIEEVSREIMKENIKAHKLTAWTSFFTVLSGVFGYLLLLFMGNSMMGYKVRDFAALMKITQYRGEMMKSLMCVNSCNSNMKINLSGVDRVDEVI